MYWRARPRAARGQIIPDVPVSFTVEGVRVMETPAITGHRPRAQNVQSNINWWVRELYVRVTEYRLRLLPRLCFFSFRFSFSPTPRLDLLPVRFFFYTREYDNGIHTARDDIIRSAFHKEFLMSLWFYKLYKKKRILNNSVTYFSFI